MRGSDLRSSDRKKIVKEVNKILGMLKRTFYIMNTSLGRNLYVSLMRSQMVLIKASKTPKGFGNLSYEERIKRLNITLLKDTKRRI